MLDLAADRLATLGTTRLVCLDGPAGSGKTTLAAAIAALVPDARVVHMDDLYDGWRGLPLVADRLEGLLRPLVTGAPGHYRRWDWHADAPAEAVEVAPAPLLVVEGVGSGSGPAADLVTVLVWVQAPDDLRLRRGMARDGEAVRPQWTRWMRDEREHLERERTRERADLVVDGTGAAAPRAGRAAAAPGSPEQT